MNRTLLLSGIFFLAAAFNKKELMAQNRDAVKPPTKYYLSDAGDDRNPGTKKNPWKTLNKLKRLYLHAGDAILFEGGSTFYGTLEMDSTNIGRSDRPITIGSYGNGYALINAGNNSAISLKNTKYITIKRLELVGSGRKTGNTMDGLSMRNCKHIFTDSVAISGFQKSGLYIYASSNVSATHIFAHDNGAAGISVEGPYPVKASCHNIYIAWCRAENNPGDPTNLTNHSGNGIVVGDCRKVMIEYCTATNNGWDMPRIGNGPVGIWAYEADSVTIQHCLSYNNKTSAGGADGGGFDLDGGVTHSVVQYCLSYGNQGAGYCIFQYLYASPWHDNIFRYNISENDGSVSDAQAGVHVWNSSGDSTQFYNCLFHNNTIYNKTGAAISFSELSKRRNFSFCNNILVGEDSLIKGERGIDKFLANDWWSITKKFSVEGIYDFKEWVMKSGQEMLKGKTVGLNIDPGFRDEVGGLPVSATTLKAFAKYTVPKNSLLRHSGVAITKSGIKKDNTGFNGKPFPLKGIGASF